MRQPTLRHVDTEIAPAAVDEWADRPRDWRLLLAVPLMPVVGLAVLAWGAVMFGVGAVAAGGKLVWETLPARGTTRRGLTWLWRSWRRTPADPERGTIGAYRVPQ